MLLLLALGYLALNSLYPLLNRPLANTFYLGTTLDDWIPFSAPWIIPYVVWYLYLPTAALLLMSRNQQRCAQAILSMILGLACSFLIFSFFQTTVPRPEVLGSDIFSAAVRVIYKIDEPYNAFPSIHVLATFILMLVAARTKELEWPIKATLGAVGIAIILSTVFVKQHVVADILGGIVVAYGCCSLVEMAPFWKYFPTPNRK